MYRINDVVVYRRDVCKVVAKKKSDFTGEMCYVLVPYDSTDRTVTMQVPVSNRAGHLRDLVPDDILFVAESGIRTAQDVQILREIGTDACLVGETLMRAPDKAAMLRELRGLRGPA